ncbi:fumarylacetoacetate hydrolase family protein [Candidimonas nitroreducens]|uniref:2-keto-4-pentenoate hydratase n=1 Tax=Candidimonas nitroreducens TaxID=683354 RepID=A0A225M4H0_9BURK|nr:fumarylacetoacetate hydrolase family protein [Candidimonas nitroreducens]OWT56168.1 2-keto-4-pentenoate hydratase [Candidimonas nitroreducens]
MKLARFSLQNDPAERLGVVLEDNGAMQLLDVAALPWVSENSGFPMAMKQVIDAGQAGLDALRETVRKANAEADPAWLHRAEEIVWLPPVPPRSCIAAGRNFGAHRMESIHGNPKAGAGFQMDFPTGFIKLGRNLVGHRAEVKRPEDVEQMDYEVEVAVVVGESLLNASRTQARQAVFGYTIMNDLSAREWQFAEMRNLLLMMGKNFPGFGPLGPCILTADEVPDPTALRLWLTVNGELRQQSDCTDLIFQFDELVAFWSRIGLEAGDVIASGTPEGVAVHRKPDPRPFFLKPGDIVHAGVDQIGVLETRIV